MSDETYTLKRIRDQVSNYIRDNDPATLSLIDDFINIQLQSLARSRDWKELEVVNSFNTISSVAGQGYLALPGDCVQVKQISDRTNEIVLLNKNTLDMIQDDLVRFETNGTPIFYTELGLKATKAPLSTDDTLDITASSATDDGKRIRIKGLSPVSSPGTDHVIEETVGVLNAGQTTTNTWKQGWSIHSISTESPPLPTAGRFDIEETTGGADLGSFSFTRRETKYFIVQFNQPPASASNLLVVYKRRVDRLIHDDESPIIPVGEALTQSTIARMREFNRDYQQAQKHDALANEHIQTVLAERDLQVQRIRQLRPDMRTKKFIRGFRGL